MPRAEAIDPRRVRDLAQPLRGVRADLDPVVDAAARCRFVLLGEATHGTHEFYHMRAEITERLIRECGFAAVAIEGDWPDAERVDRFVRGAGANDAEDALGGFRRFPAWMWRNADVLDFVGRLRSVNRTRPTRERVGFFGLDLYSLHRSIDAVLGYLNGVDPSAAERARERYACFDRFGPDMESYAYRVGAGLDRSCRREALEVLLELQRRSFDTAEGFYAEQNARVVASAEMYYRTMIDQEISSWNLRDRFMSETLERLALHLARTRGEPAKIVVWAHNSHVGDARATSMGAGRELNLGQLTREANAASTLLVGFTTCSGSVTAASRWYADAERKRVRAPMPRSWEALFAATGMPAWYLDLRGAADAYPLLRARLLERAIGVVYRPETELASHYLEARIVDQFDALFHYEHTRAVEPLERTPHWEAGEVPESFPSGI